MATKPTTQPPEWASALVYLSGPKVGQNTKSSTAAGAAVEGHKPGPTEPTTANEFNKYCNQVSLLARWSFAGRFDKAADAHPVETDDTGLLSARAADFGDVTQPGPSLTVSNSATDVAARITAVEAESLVISSNVNLGGKQPVVVMADGFGLGLLHAVRIICADPVAGLGSYGGLRVDAATGDAEIDNQDRVAAVNLYNRGGPALQLRTTETAGVTLRAVSLNNGATTARFGFGRLEAPARNLGGLAVTAEGGPGNAENPGPLPGGDGINGSGGDSANGSFPQPPGWGVVGNSGLTVGGNTEAGGGGVLARSNHAHSHGLRVEADSVSMVVPLLYVDGTGFGAGDGAEIEMTEAGSAARLKAQTDPGLRVEMTPDLGGDTGPAVHLAPQAEPWSATPGELSAVGDTDDAEYRCVGNDGYAVYVQRSGQPPCYGRAAFQGGGHLISGIHVVPLPLEDFTFDPGMIPTAPTKVRGTVWGFVRIPAGIDLRNAQFQLRDLDAPNTIAAGEVSYDNTAGGDFVHLVVSNAQVYQVPAAGQRNWRLQFVGDVFPVGNIEFYGWAEVPNITGRDGVA